MSGKSHRVKMVTRAVSLLVLGACINVGVAWWGTSIPFANFGGQMSEELELVSHGWPEAVPASWASPQNYGRVEVGGLCTFEVWFHRWDAAHPNETRDSGAPEAELFVLSRWRSGFPLRSMEWSHQSEVWLGSAKSWEKSRGGVVMPRAASRAASIVRRQEIGNWHVPLRPVWGGFVVNTLVYAGVAEGVIGGARSVRAWRRRGGGRCVGCGYDLTGVRVCPECGR